MKIAILGFGVEGRAAYNHWRQSGNRLTICDQNESITLPSDVGQQLGPDYLYNLDAFELIVRSPSIHPRAIVAANSPEILHKITTNTNEFFRVCPTKNIISVTGTKGKGTTSTLIAKMLESAGNKVHLGGNIGIPPLDLLKNNIQPEDWVVLELSNFQLIDLNYSPPTAVCLMVVPEHMDWHQDMNEYISAKQRLFAHQRSEDLAIYFGGNDNSQKVTSVSRGRRVPFYTEPGAHITDNKITISGHVLCHTDEIKLLGKHNWQNVCAAITTVWFSLNPAEDQAPEIVEAMRSVLTTFTGLEHRLEFVRELDGVKYYDDSFGTTPETATVAIEAFAQPKVILLGGSDKGASYRQLARTVQSHNVRQAVLIGQTAPAIQAALQSAGFTDFVLGGNNLEEIIKKSRLAARPGDVVLLSPACASFDMFPNYKVRGEQFKQAVQSL